MPRSNPGFLCYSDPFRHKTFRPLFFRLAAFPLVLGYSRPLVGVNTESSEVIREIPPSTFPPAPLRSPHSPSPLRTSRYSAVSCPLMLVTNPANRIHLLRVVVSMLSVGTCLREIIQTGNRVVGAVVFSPADAASQKDVPSST